MGTILASAIATKIATDIFDPDGDRFGDSDYLSSINEGQRQAVIAKQDVNMVSESVQLVAGTKQTLSAGKLALARLVKNKGLAGTTEGKPIYFVDLDDFSRKNRNWHTATASATVQVYMYDDGNPATFYVYPPQPASDQGYVEMVAPELPADIAAIGAAINIGDEYEMVLYHYGMYDALMVDAKHSALALQDALTHLNQFYTLLGRLDLVEWKSSKKVTKEATQQ